MKSRAILPRLLVALAVLVKASTAQATITVSGLTNQTRYNDSVTITIAAEAGFTTTVAVLKARELGEQGQGAKYEFKPEDYIVT
jgi:hypothetical protein